MAVALPAEFTSPPCRLMLSTVVYAGTGVIAAKLLALSTVTLPITELWSAGIWLPDEAA